MIKDKKPYSILVIEDNPGDFTIIEDFLREHILTPLIVHVINYKQASAILSGADILFDVILLDLSLPDKSRQSLIVEMLRIAPLFPIIILTGYPDIDFSIKSISQGVFDYLLKDDLNATSLYKSILYSIERKKTISELERSEKRAGDLFNLSPQPMWVYDPETLSFIQVNVATIEHYGYSNEEFLKMTIIDIQPINEILKAREVINNPKVKSDEILNEKLKHCKKSGEVIDVDLFSSPLIINGKNYRSVIAIDITEKNLYEHKLIKAIIKTQEDERYEIGGELHDNVCQVLAVSQLSLGMLKGSIAPEKMFLFDQCRDQLSVVFEEIRNLSHRLAPAFLDHSTLAEAFCRLLNTFNPDEKFDIRIYFDEEIKNHEVSLDIQINLYRILQEQMRNIQKYANAGLIEADVIIHNNRLKMRISDNGVGFNVNAIKGGIGFANMKRRTELFSGIFEVESSPGNGCTINIEIPLQETNEFKKAVK